ncbi:S49 family peptidase [Polynucleobacter rarus]|jgi:protease-4|uniref:S49 family peptidase n=1 Tax=Polynucleobacter rarus TaxID=556055 RepID=UPI000D3EC955|nr:S49 family peptidase [Polynucleobacter rarus]
MTTNDANWEKTALENLLKENLKERQSNRRWRTFWRLLGLAITIALVYSYFAPFKKSASVLSHHTALIKLDGEISSGTSANASDIMMALQNAFETPEVGGVILKINSPGGSPVQSGMIYDEMMRLRKANPEKHLYVVIEDICASGGYYIAAAGEKIFVDKASLVGSIGVIMAGFGFTGLMDKVGVERRVQTAGENKAMLDPFMKQNPKNTQSIQAMLDEIHQQFIKAVKDGRGTRLKETPDMFSGMVWNGSKAVELGLADDFGTVESVARDVIKYTDVVDYTQTENVAERLAKRFGATLGNSFASALQKVDLK